MPLQQVTKTTKPEAAKGKPNIEWRGQEHITPGKGVYRPACQERRFVPSLTFIATTNILFFCHHHRATCRVISFLIAKPERIAMV